MPLGPGVRFRVKRTKKGKIRLAFRGKKVIEVKKLSGRNRGVVRRILSGR